MRLLLVLLLAMPAQAQPPGLDALRGALGELSPEEKRAFCGRVARAALGCGTLDPAALSACLIRTLPAADSVRAARAARNGPGGLLSECGIGR